MEERIIRLGDLIKEAAIDSAVHRDKSFGAGPVERAWARVTYTGNFLYRKGEEDTEIVYDAKRDNRSPNVGPLGNEVFSRNAAPELTGMGRFVYDAITGITCQASGQFGVPFVEDSERKNMLALNREARRNPDGSIKKFQPGKDKTI